MQITRGKVVSIDYTLTDPQGKVIDSSNGHDPLNYLHGVGGIIRGLEEALEGKAEGDKLSVTIPPEKAYGERDEALVESVPRSAFAGIEKVEPGMQFQAKHEGQIHLVTVIAADADTVRVDPNHPLAGQTLHFEVTVVGVRDASPEELQHGHVHGKGGHHH